MKNLSTIQQLLIKAAGYDLETAKSCTSAEINKIAKHGTLIIIPAFVGLFSMSYAMYLISKNTLIAGLGGLAWGIIIFFIDRSLVSLNRPGTFNLGMLGRFLFAVIIGFVVAEPVVLLTFKDAIQEELNGSFITKKDNVSTKFSSEFALLNTKLTDAKKNLEKKQNIYTAELDGSGGSGNANKGPIFKQKYADYQAELVAYNNLKTEIDNQVSRKQLEMNTEINSIREMQANGLLGQFRALHAIEDKEVEYATWALRLFFFFIEIIPFLIKISPTKGGDLYYDIKDNQDKIQLEIVTSNNTYKKELMECAEKSLNMERALKLNELNTKKVATSNDINTELITKQMYNAVEKKIKQDLKVIKNVNNDDAKEKLLSQINLVFDGYFKNMEDLIIKSNQFYSKNI